nr:caspase-3 isoform X2 [Parasteatoda tepidariorum]
MVVIWFRVMTANSKEEEKDSNIFEEILNKLTNSNFISIFFLLLENYIKPDRYLWIINQDKSEKIKILEKILLTRHIFAKDLLIEILWTIKRYDLLKNLDVCQHSYQCQSSGLNRIWKSLYEVCDSFDGENDFKYFKKFFPEMSISDEERLEEFLVEKYNAKEISKSGMAALLTDLNNENQKSKTWALPDEYLIKQPTITSPCGLAVIINHENFNWDENSGLKLERRKDSLLDVDALKDIWKSFGLATETYNDLKEEEILRTFQELSERDFSIYDILVVCYMSHGNEGVVYSSDCKPIQITSLIDLMANKCKSLIGKPKLFFIQACQGAQIQCGISNPVFSPQPVTNSSFDEYPNDTPYFVDVLVAVSTIPGFVSFASRNNNSWFIQALVENVEQFGHQKNFTDVMIKVTNDVSHRRGECNFQGQPIKNCKQTVETKSTLRKELHLKKLRS